MNRIKKKILLAKLELKARMPEAIKFWKEFLTLPLKKRIKSEGYTPEDWGRDGFLTLCDHHIDLFKDEKDLDGGDTIGYHVCQAKGCTRTATHELFPNLKDRLEDIDL